MKDLDFNQFRTDFKNAVTELEQKYGLSITLKGIRYDYQSFTSTIDAVRVDVNTDDPDAVDRARFNRHVNSVPGVSEAHFGRQFDNFGELFRIIGLKPKATKYPIIAEKLDNKKRYKFPLKVIHNLEPAQS